MNGCSVRIPFPLRVRNRRYITAGDPHDNAPPILHRPTHPIPPETDTAMWKTYALLSAFFAALTAIFAKLGVKDINADLATAIRTLIILFLTWGIVLADNHLGEIRSIGRNTWIFLLLSGVATGLSWLFYFKALQNGNVSFVAPIDKLSVVITIILSCIILKEPLTWRTIAGGLMIAGGSLVLLTK